MVFFSALGCDGFVGALRLAYAPFETQNGRRLARRSSGKTAMADARR